MSSSSSASSSSSSSAAAVPSSQSGEVIVLLDGDDVIEHRITESTRSSYERTLKVLVKEFESNEAMEDALFYEPPEGEDVIRALELLEDVLIYLKKFTEGFSQIVSDNLEALSMEILYNVRRLNLFKSKHS